MSAKASSPRIRRWDAIFRLRFPRLSMPTDPNANLSASALNTPDSNHQSMPPEERLKRMVETFKLDLKEITGKPDAGETFAKMIESSPYAKELLLKAVEDGSLTRFVHGEGSPLYRRGEKTISFNARDIETAGFNEHLFADAVGTLGHEARHAAGRGTMEKASERFWKDLETALDTGGLKPAADGRFHQSPVDLTPALKRIDAAHRTSEASAELANFNSVSSMLKTQNDGQAPTLLQIWQASPDNLRQYMELHTDPASGSQNVRMRAGLELNADTTLPETPKNVEAMAKLYYDSRDKGSLLGNHFGTDYSHHYASSYLEASLRTIRSIDEETAKQLVPRQVHINMKELGLDEKSLERLMQLPDGKPFVYYDTSSGKPVKSSFDPYVENKQTSPGQDKPVEPKHTLPGKAGKGPDPGDPGIGALAEPASRAGDAMERLNPRQRADLGTIDAALTRDGRWDANSARNIAGDLLLQVARDPSVKEVQRVAFSDPTTNARVFAMYSLSEDRGPHFHVSVHAAVSMQRDASASLEQVAMLDRATAQSVGRDQTLLRQNEQTAERGQSGPRMA